ncbi:hypothetical protein EVAR_87360_1 [Eumeta japonica]|uniref:Uncharacterized protein n=1 Tax=Eumeta variegata TaxID=151549 RepID=A0A4C1XYI7_EUMVA|nr:hypothetical protein EVAR_87360_1 [Eumeta japonica]
MRRFSTHVLLLFLLIIISDFVLLFVGNYLHFASTRTLSGAHTTVNIARVASIAQSCVVFVHRLLRVNPPTARRRVPYEEYSTTHETLPLLDLVTKASQSRKIGKLSHVTLRPTGFGFKIEIDSETNWN